MSFVDCDIFFEEDRLEEGITALLPEDGSVTHEVIDEDGPANWPVVRFTGTREALEALLLRYHGGDQSAADDYKIFIDVEL